MKNKGKSKHRISRSTSKLRANKFRIELYYFQSSLHLGEKKKKKIDLANLLGQLRFVCMDIVAVLGTIPVHHRLLLCTASDALQAKLLLWAAVSCQLVFDNEVPLDGSVYCALEGGQSSEADGKLPRGTIKLIVSNFENNVTVLCFSALGSQAVATVLSRGSFCWLWTGFHMWQLDRSSLLWKTASCKQPSSYRAASSRRWLWARLCSPQWETFVRQGWECCALVSWNRKKDWDRYVREF